MKFDVKPNEAKPSVEKTDFNPDKRINFETKQQKIDEPVFNPDKRVEFSNKEKLETALMLNNAIKETKNYSECPEFIDRKQYSIDNLYIRDASEVKQIKSEFTKQKDHLIKEWEIKNNAIWPTYKEDVYLETKNGDRIKIRNAGDKLDCHHIIPVKLGGNNEVSNITPISAETHMDHKGIHSMDSNVSKLISKVGEVQNG